MINVRDFGAVGTGDPNTNDTPAFVAAHNALPATGGCIYIPSGIYLIEPNQFVITKPGVRLLGDGWLNTTLRRRTDVDGVVIHVVETGTAFTASDFSLFEAPVAAGTLPSNTGTLLRATRINEFSLSRCWLQSGYELLNLEEGSNYEISNCVFENGRLYGVHAIHISDLRISDSAFYGTGIADVDPFPPGPAAGIRIEKKQGFDFRPFQTLISGNSFVISNIGHNIHAIGAANVTIANNHTDLAGRFNPGKYDEIHLQSCESVTITGNTSALEFNLYSHAMITGATNAEPIVITTATAHGFEENWTMVINGVEGNTAANGTWEIDVLSPTTFALVGSKGNGAYTGGGRANTRGTAYNVNIDANCSKVRVVGNTFNRGAKGTINDLAADTVVYASVIGEWPRRFLNASVDWDMGATADGAIASTTVTVPGAAVGDPVSVSLSSLGNWGALLSAHVMAANTVLVIVLNKSGVTLDPAPGTLNVAVMKR